jgi:hypothetical protein
MVYLLYRQSLPPKLLSSIHNSSRASLFLSKNAKGRSQDSLAGKFNARPRSAPKCVRVAANSHVMQTDQSNAFIQN